MNFVDFWNIHEDKGHLELNYIIPMTELTTGKALNPFPPGKATYEFKDAFDSYINHQLGYDQVVRNPLKASSSKFETKVLLIQIQNWLNKLEPPNQTRTTSARMLVIKSYKARSPTDSSFVITWRILEKSPESMTSSSH